MVEAAPEGPRYRTRLSCGAHTWIADTRKEGHGGDDGPRPHELLEAALAACIAITAHTALEDLGVDPSGLRACVELERTASTSTSRCELTSGCELDSAQRRVLRERVERSPVRATLARRRSFTLS
jgi:putative redox protein